MMADAGFLAVGAFAGTLHFALLRWNTALYARAGRIAAAAALQVLRLGALAGLLVIVARQGALPLLLAALGLLIARSFVIRWMAAAP
jgi:hypothetical protein